VRYAKGRLRGRSPFTIRYSLQELAGTESSRPLLQIAPPMNRLDVLGMIVSPSPSHPFGLDMCDLKHILAGNKAYLGR